jgi:hypothetical protein
MIELGACMAMQSWVNREYRRGLRISRVEMLFPTLTTWGAARQKVQDPVAQGGVETQGLELNDEFGGY